jgi:hypothetical protein
MAKSRKLTQRKFAEVVACMHANLFLDGSPVPTTDCVALREFVEAAQVILFRDCPIARPTITRKKKG